MAKIVWKRRNVATCVCFVSLIVIIAVVTLVYFNSLCQDSVSIDQLNRLCDLYREGRVTGDLCNALCTDRSLRFHKCLHGKRGKKVYHLSWNNSFNIIMKSKHPSLGDFFTFDFRKVGSNQLFPIPAPSILRETFSGLLKSRFGKDSIYTKDLELWEIQENDLQYKSQVVTNWLLYQQDEYLLMKYLRYPSSIPQLYGNCGYYYATEFLPPGNYLKEVNFGLRIFPSGWKKRVDLALQLMDLMKSFTEDFGTPFHFCDMKGSNFGIDLHGKVKPVDLDMAVSDEYLQEIFSQESCSDDSNCEFFDCKGRCIPSQHKCLPLRTNTNIQTLCENILEGDLRHLISAGLLSSPPSSIQHELTGALSRCRNPAVSPYYRTIGRKCSSVSGTERAEGTDVCLEAIAELQTFLRNESRSIHHLLIEILSKGLNADIM